MWSELDTAIAFLHEQEAPCLCGAVADFGCCGFASLLEVAMGLGADHCRADQDLLWLRGFRVYRFSFLARYDAELLRTKHLVRFLLQTLVLHCCAFVF